MYVLLFNAAMLAVDALALRWLARRRDGRGFLTAAVVAAGACGALVVAGALVYHARELHGPTRFALVGLAAWGLFAHATPLAAAAGWLLWRARPRLARASAALAGALAAAGVWGFVVEPRWIELTRIEIASRKLEHPCRIVVLADLQTDRPGDYERRAVRMALAQEPDLLVLLGDYVQEVEADAWEEDARRLNAIFREERLSAPLGVIAVRGDVDPPWWERVFEGIDATLVEETTRLAIGELALTALSVRDSHDPRLRLAPDERFHVVLGHGPDHALGDVPADLLLAGHTHGGQVVLPFVGPPMVSARIPRAWASGRTELPGGRTLVVSRGVGMERCAAPRVRFLCRPEVVSVDLLPAAP